MKKKSFVLLVLSFLFFSLFYQHTSVHADENISDTSIVLVIDTSSSMWGSPINSVKDAARNFVLNMDQSVPIAIATFANQAQIVQDYTTDKIQLLETIDDLTPEGVTALYDGAMIGVDYAGQSTASNRIVILLSDGAEYGNQSQSTRYDAMLHAQSQGILVYSIGLGFGADQSYLEEIATRTNGVFYSTNLEEDVVNIYAQLSTDLSVLDATFNRDATTSSENNTVDLTSIHGNTSNSTYVYVNDIQASFEPRPVFNESPIEPLPDDLAVPAQPSLDTSVEDISTENTAIVLTIDVSQSMWGTPINSAIEAMQSFILDIDPNIPVAIVTFGNQAQLVQDFTTDKTLLLQAIANLTPAGVTALYDGALLSVEVAAESGAGNPVVLLLSDGGEYGGQSDAGRDDALLMAQALDVSITAIGYGFGIDRSYLESLSSLNNGTLYEVDNREALFSVYTGLSQQFEFVESTSISTTNQSTIAPLSDDVASEFGNSPLLQSEFPLSAEPVPEAIVPLDSDISALNLNSQSSPNNEGIGPLTEETTTIRPTELEEVEVDPMANIVPITVTVADSVEVESLSIYVNSYELATFTEAPYTFDLDTLLLSAGSYNLGVEVHTSNNIISEARIPFEVSLLPSQTEVTTAEASVSESTGNSVDVTTENTISTAPVFEERVLTINGQEQSFNFEYSLLTGLTLKTPVLSTENLAASQTLGQILARPLQIIPQPVVDYLTIPRPKLITAIIIIMTLILLPQGLFTIYWMTYTWVSPERIEKSSSPKEFSEPQNSFTSLLPARKEAAVIYDTIMTVNRIDYPEHLKETLVMIRDEDDDATIAATERAINDIRQSYWDRGEEYPDNVHLVTFKDGPYNKPNGLNRGYAVSTKDVICIFDAEDQPHRDIYNIVNTVMIRDEADVVQSGVQLMNFKSKWFSAFNVLEYFFWFKSGLHAFTHELGVTPLGGNTVFFKKNWLDILAKEDVEKGYRVWDEAGLTEDGDIGIRLTQMGANIQIVYDAVQATQEETPDSVEQFIKQRTRWNQGFYQIFAKGVWRELPSLKQRITAIYILLNSLLQASIMLFLPVGIFIAVTQDVAVAIALISYLPIYILIGQLMLNMVGIKEFTEAYGLKLPFLFRLKMLATFYPFQLLLSFSALRAISRFITNQSSWEKTTHSNLHRQGTGAIPVSVRA